MSAYYFDSFPITDYSFDSKNYFLITDFTSRVKVNKFLTSTSFVYDSYDLLDGERPEDVAYKFYNTTQLHWVLLLVNDIIDPYDDWCLSSDSVTAIAKKKYSNIFATHHWVNDKGFVVDSPYLGIEGTSILIDPVSGPFPVSNLQNDTDINEKKRTIKILKPQLVNTFVSEFRKAIA